MSIQNTITEIETQVAGLQALIEETRAKVAPLQAELDVLVAQEQELRQRMALKVTEISAARGGQSWVDLKRKLGILASTRMQLRAALAAMRE
jgi:capsule polysaccharide export protein KpsE/RkpR